MCSPGLVLSARFTGRMFLLTRFPFAFDKWAYLYHFPRMTFSPWGNEKMKVLAKCFEIFRYKNGEQCVVMGLLLPGCFIERKCGFSGGEGRLGDEDQSQDLCLWVQGQGSSGPGSSRAGEVWVGLRSIFQVRSPRALQGHGPTAKVIWVAQAKAPSLGLALVDT